MATGELATISVGGGGKEEAGCCGWPYWAGLEVVGSSDPTKGATAPTDFRLRIRQHFDSLTTKCLRAL
jgi:hypothetical protein